MSEAGVAAVEAAARARSRALVAGDAAAMDALLADGFVYTNANGHVAGKPEYIEGYVASEEVRWERQDLSGIEVAQYGDAAIVTCLVHDVAVFGEQPFEGRFRSTLVFVRESGTWRCAAGHTSPAPATS